MSPCGSSNTSSTLSVAHYAAVLYPATQNLRGISIQYAPDSIYVVQLQIALSACANLLGAGMEIMCQFSASTQVVVCKCTNLLHCNSVIVSLTQYQHDLYTHA